MLQFDMLITFVRSRSFADLLDIDVWSQAWLKQELFSFAKGLRIQSKIVCA